MVVKSLDNLAFHEQVVLVHSEWLFTAVVVGKLGVVLEQPLHVAALIDDNHVHLGRQQVFHLDLHFQLQDHLQCKKINNILQLPLAFIYLLPKPVITLHNSQIHHA